MRFFIVLFALLYTTSGWSQPIKHSAELVAWCVVPFDAKKRSPAERVPMLKELGFTQYAYDWRTEHLPEMVGEWKLAQEHGISIHAVWIWINPKRDQPGQLGNDNQKLIDNIRQAGLETTLWVGISEDYFAGESDDKAATKAVLIIKHLAQEAKEMKCNLALYNHGGWLGDPENQIKVIEALPQFDIGIVYNFHHAHEHLDRFTSLVPAMLPYLRCVNLNGMRKAGPKILPLGKGDQEAAMLKILLAHQYEGPFGILGHVETEDVKIVLQENLSGFDDVMDGITKF